MIRYKKKIQGNYIDDIITITLVQVAGCGLDNTSLMVICNGKLFTL